MLYQLRGEIASPNGTGDSTTDCSSDLSPKVELGNRLRQILVRYGGLGCELGTNDGAGATETVEQLLPYEEGERGAMGALSAKDGYAQGNDADG